MKLRAVIFEFVGFNLRAERYLIAMSNTNSRKSARKLRAACKPVTPLASKIARMLWRWRRWFVSRGETLTSKLSVALALVAVTSSLAGGMAICSAERAQANAVLVGTTSDASVVNGLVVPNLCGKSHPCVRCGDGPNGGIKHTSKRGDGGRS